MNRSLTLVCMLASGLSVSPMAMAAAQDAPAAPTPATSAAASNTAAPNPAGASVSSAPSGPAKVAVIAFQQAVAMTNEGQRDFGQLQTKFEPKRTALKSQSDEIDALKKQLQTSGTTLSETDRAARLKTIDDKEKALQRSAEDAQNDFNNEMNTTYQGLAQKLYEVMSAYAQQNGYSLVLDASASQQQTSPVLWANAGTDVTQAVVNAYNAKSGVPAQPGATGATAPRTGSTGSSTPARTAPGTSRPATRPSTTAPKPQ